jgi:hypothetical protein
MDAAMINEFLRGCNDWNLLTWRETGTVRGGLAIWRLPPYSPSWRYCLMDRS